MKKIFLIAATICTGLVSYAQEKNVTDANLALQEDHDPAKAKEYIEKAIQDPSTKDQAKTWFVRSTVYFALQNDPKYKDTYPYREAAQSLEKVISIKPDYEKEAITKNLLVCAYFYFNDGIMAYNAKKFSDAADLMQQTLDIHNIEGGKRYSNNKSFDSVASNARFVKANSLYYDHKYDDAITLLNEIKSDPISVQPAVYMELSDAYAQQHKDDQSVAAIEEGRKAYPKDAALRTAELNYYIRTGKQDEMMKKLEDAVAQDPNNAELQFALATGYNNAAFPEKGSKPANFDQYIGKAEAAYQKAIQIAPDNAMYNYNLGALYYNQASDLITQMNALGTSPAEMKKYDQLKEQRDQMFTKALPYLEKTYNILDPKVSSLSADERNTYHSTLTALREIYARQNKLDKAAEMKKKIEAFH